MIFLLLCITYQTIVFLLCWFPAHFWLFYKQYVVCQIIFSLDFKFVKSRKIQQEPTKGEVKKWEVKSIVSAQLCKMHNPLNTNRWILSKKTKTLENMSCKTDHSKHVIGVNALKYSSRNRKILPSCGVMFMKIYKTQLLFSITFKCELQINH